MDRLRRLRPRRFTLAMRLLLLCCSVAAGSTALALALQDRKLSEDLENAASVRLERAASAVDRLVELRMAATTARYRTASESSHLRANLESRHDATLAYYTEELRGRQSAALIAFLDPSSHAVAHAGEASLLERVLAEEASADPQQASSRLISDGGALYIAVTIPVRTGDRLLGRMIGAERVDASLLQEWSQLCGTRVLVEARAQRSDDQLAHAVRGAGDYELRVSTSFEPERAALAASRLNLLAAGLGALLAAIVTSAFAANRFVVPIRKIQSLAEHITQHDFSKRLRMKRIDEIGDVARAFDAMLERLERTQGRLASAQHFARLGNWSVDVESGELEGSDEFSRILQIKAFERPASYQLLVGRAHPEDRAALEQVLKACLERGSSFQLDHRVLLSGGEERLLHTRGARCIQEDGAVRMEGTVQDITERKQIEDEVRFLAYHDVLTGLGSRRLFDERLDLALRARPRDQSIGVLFLDIDHFKIINDTLGHSQGDELLREVATRLVACTASDDEHSTILVTRQGGDEFTILIDRLQNPDDLSRLAQGILEALKPAFDLQGQRVSITGSIGIASCPRDGQSTGDLLRSSDTAMYQAKREGRDRFSFYTEAMQEAAFERLHLESQLRQALERSEFEVYYQPRVDVRTGRVAALEALLRWRDADQRMRGPAEFVPLAEETGLIRPIGAWVLREAVREAQSWQDLGSPRVSVNLSFHQVDNDDFVEIVANVLEETQFDPARLELEITESALMRNEERAIEVLTELKQLGVQLSMDDFGTGYSSLSYLRILPIDTVKIDRSFVRRVATDSDDNGLVSAIVSIAKLRRLSVTAEGVEDEDQRDCLIELGCDELQGFYFSAAVPASQVRSAVIGIEKSTKPAAARRRRQGRSEV